MKKLLKVLPILLLIVGGGGLTALTGPDRKHLTTAALSFI